MASVYMGVMSHFGIGTAKSAQRAQRYYEAALAVGAAPAAGPAALPTQLKLMVQTLQWMVSVRGYSLLSPLTLSVEYVVQMLWAQPS